MNKPFTMNKLILNCTEANTTTIIPNFGAIMKMGKTFMYNEFLKYDDGKLAKFVASEKGIDEAQAKEEVTKWAESIQSDLDAGKTVVLDGVGELTRTDGKTKFVAKTGATVTSEAPKVEEKKITPAPVIKEEVKEKVKEVAPPKAEKKEEVKEKKAEKKKEKKTQKSSGDLKATEAITKIGKFKDKNELIEYTRGETRKTVVAALNTKLDELNGKKKSKESKEWVETNEVKPPKNVVTEVISEPVTPVIEKPELKEEKPVVAETPQVEKETAKPVDSPVEPESPKEEKPVEIKTPPPVVEPLKEEKTIKEKAAEIETKKVDPKEEELAIAAIVDGVEKSEKQTGKRKKKGILWIALILILIGGGTVGYLKMDVIKGWFEKSHEPKDLAEGHSEETPEKDGSETSHESTDNVETTEEHTETAETAVDEANETDPTEEIAEEEVPVEEVVEEKTEETPPVTNTASEGSWHIVAGSYSSETNAENKVASLKSDGYSNAKVLGKYNGLYTVRVASYPTKDEAKSALESYTSSGNKGFIKNL